MLRKRGLAAGEAWGVALAAAVALAALPAQAQDTGAPLIPEGTPPAVQGKLAAAPPSLWAAELGVGAGVALVSVPLTLGLASFLGTLPNNLVLAALPPLLLAVVPPLAVTLAESFVGHALSPGRTRILPAFWAALGTQVLAVVGGIALGLSSGNWAHVALFTAAEAVLLPAAVTLTVNAGQPASAAGPTVARRTEAWLPQARGVSLLRASF